MSWMDFSLEQNEGLSVDEFLAVYGRDLEIFDYDKIFDHLDTEVAIKVEDDNYSGDTRYLVLHDKRGWGISIVGWGSCSGCDALQGCSTDRERLELLLQIRDQIRWFFTAGEALEYLENHDWAGDSLGRTKENQEFIEKSIALLWGQRGSHAELERIEAHGLPAHTPTA